MANSIFQIKIKYLKKVLQWNVRTLPHSTSVCFAEPMVIQKVGPRFFL